LGSLTPFFIKTRCGLNINPENVNGLGRVLLRTNRFPTVPWIVGHIINNSWLYLSCLNGSRLGRPQKIRSRKQNMRDCSSCPPHNLGSLISSAMLSTDYASSTSACAWTHFINHPLVGACAVMIHYLLKEPVECPVCELCFAVCGYVIVCM